MDIREMLRRLRRGQSNRAIATDLGIDRKTVSRYRAWAIEQGLLAGSLPSLSNLQQLLEETLNSSPPPQNTSTVEPYREPVVKSDRNVSKLLAHGLCASTIRHT